MKKQFFFIAIFLVFLIGCNPFKRKSEGSEDASKRIKLTTTARFETTPMPESNEEDAADDPAIWVDQHTPSKSKIIGTDKKGGLAVYNLHGEQLYYYADGNMNNVDIRYGFITGNDTVDLVCASNRSNRSIAIYKINRNGSLKNIDARIIQSEMSDEVYGFCLYKSPKNGKFYAFINSKAGEVEQWELFPVDSLVDARLVRHFNLETQVEGMVTDDENQKLYVGEENNGIWKFEAEPSDGGAGEKIPKSSENDNENIRYDIEGLAIYYLPGGKGYLLASSQGNYSFAVYERQEPHKYIGSFRIAEGIVDGAEETDGIAIYSFELNDEFKHGLLVVQDGYNYDSDSAKAQNFKLISWENVASIFTPELQMN